MLETLDEIPWAQLEHANGDAADVPGLIRQLSDPDPQILNKALSRLYETVFHQGIRFPATPFVIPFLMELCESPLTPDRGTLLHFWGDLITGAFSIQERPLWSDGLRIYSEEPGQDFGTNPEYGKILQDIYEASLPGESLLYQLLEDEDSFTRAEAAWVIGCLPTLCERSVPRLRNRLIKEPDEWVRAAIAFSLGENGDSDCLQEIVGNEEEDRAVKCIAACQLARLKPSSELIKPLLSFIEHPIEGYENIPGAGGTSGGDAAFSITTLPDEMQKQAIPYLCEQLGHARAIAAIPLVTSLLSAAFEIREDPLDTPDTLQQKALISMAQAQEIWSLRGISSVLAAYGLPSNRDQCAKLAGVTVTRDEALAQLSTAILFAEMNFLERAREGIEMALTLDPTVFARLPSPAEYWLFYAKAFAETDQDRALQAFDHARSIQASMEHKVPTNWKLANLISNRKGN